MKIIKWIFALALLCNVQMASAQVICNPRDMCFSDLKFDLHADYLYWKVCRGDLNYDDCCDAKYINPDYDSGFRLGGRAYYECLDLGIRYTYYYNSKSKKGGKYWIDYDVVDIELGYTLCWDCKDLSIRPFLGAKLAWIDEKYDEPKSSEDDKIDFKGYGLYIGSEGHLALCNVCDQTLSLVARGCLGILDGRFKVDRKHASDFKKDCLYIPYLEAFAGLEFGLCSYCDVDADLMIGYEVQQWGDFREFDTRDDLESLGLGGLVVHLNLSF